MPNLLSIVKRSKEASRKTASLASEVKAQAIKTAAKAILGNEKMILSANAADVEAARKKRLAPALIDRLTLNPKRLADMAKALEEIADSRDPVGKVVEEWTNKDGVKIKRVRVPIGVIGMVYESRPNVTAEAAALCLKAGNSVILRGGTEALRSNTALAKVFCDTVEMCGVQRDSVILITDTDRRNIYELASLDSWVDLIIARGSEEMVRDIKKRATVPILGHGKGVCHVYVDRSANLKMAQEIAYNAKVQRPGVCNAMETLLMHKDIAQDFFLPMAARYKQAGVQIRGDDKTRKFVPGIAKATEKDWMAEYLDLIVSVKVVDSVDQAVTHINRYGSGHTDAIVTEDAASAERFLRGVDSAAVFHNVSTRMHDGGVFGLGAEIGISTAKLHARGTMGVRELTTTKYVAEGTGQIRH